MLHARRPWVALLILVLVAASGCGRSPEAKKARHLERGDRYFAREEYRDAILEYRNVLRLEPANAHAVRQLGLAHYQLGELVQAYPRLLRARDAAPDDLTVRLKLGTIYAAAQDADKARDEALFVLGKEPKSRDALALLAGTARTPEDIDDAIRRLETVRDELRGHPQIHLALALLHGNRGNAGAAERAYQDAIAADPKLPESHIALGNYYLTRRDAARAEREFRAAVELAPAGSRARLKLADFHLQVGRREEAERLLRETTTQAPDFLPAWRRLAEIAFAERRYEDSVKALDVVLKKNPADVSGQLLRGRVHLAKRESPQAIQAFQEVLRQEPGLAQARHQLALAYLESGNTQQARAELRQATVADPDDVEATLRLAELDIRSGALEPAIESLEKLVARRPGETRAHVLLGGAYLAKRDPVKAAEAYRRIKTAAPREARGPYLVGVALRAQGKVVEARKELEAALALKPDYAGPLAQLVSIALAEKRPELALERVKKQVALAPQSGQLQHLLGRVHQARREAGPAEQAYLKALELDPTLMGAYVDLAGLYVRTAKPDQALAKLESAARQSPRNPLTHTLIGALHEQKGRIPEARSAYEKALALSPRFVPAANNLAFLYAGHGGDQEKALQLAQMAREAAPEDPHVADTLGWILYKRGVYQRALGLLRESADKLPENPEVQYHLGMAAYKAGEKDTARKALTAAVASPANFPGKEEARAILAELR